MSDDGKCYEEKQSRISEWDNKANVHRLKPTVISVLNMHLPTAINSVLLPVKYYHIFIHQCIPWIFSKNLVCARYYSSHYFYPNDVNYSILNRF